jgi:hypothetical protein
MTSEARSVYTRSADRTVRRRGAAADGVLLSSGTPDYGIRLLRACAPYAVNVRIPLANWLENCCNGLGAGPFATVPEVVYREPWHGQTY